MRALEEGRFDFDTGITVSNGGLNAPLGDMAKYLLLLTSDRATTVYDGVLKRSSLEEMWKPQLPAADGEGATGSSAQAGLSFFLERHGGLDFVAHSGDQNGFISHLYVHRSSRTAYVVSFNTDVAASKASADPAHHSPGGRSGAGRDDSRRDREADKTSRGSGRARLRSDASLGS